MDWQLRLVVGHEGVELDTVPQVMANASPFFRRMLQPNGFAEGQAISRTGSTVVPLPDDDPGAMIVLCDIFHLRSEKIPLKEVTSDALADIATLVHKYDCAAAVQPWPRLWLTQLLDGRELEDTQSMDLAEVGKWTHISYHLGFNEQFTQMTSALVRRATHEDLNEGPPHLIFQKLPRVVQDSIENARYKAINAYHQICFNLIEDLKQGNHCKCVHDNSTKSQEIAFDCSSLALGNAFLAAREVCSGTNWELVENWTGSVEHYHQGMKLFNDRLDGTQRVFPQTRQFDNYTGTYRVPHSQCSLSGRFSKQIDEIYWSCSEGLGLEIVGNHLYRKTRSSSNRPKKQKRGQPKIDTVHRQGTYFVGTKRRT